MDDFLDLIAYRGTASDALINKDASYSLFAIAHTELIDKEREKPENIIDSDQKLRDYLREYFGCYRKARTLYLFSPLTEGGQLLAKKESSASSRPSRDSAVSKLVREHAKETCQICGRKFPGGVGLYACHLYETKSGHRDIVDQISSCSPLGLTYVNDYRNYLCLCKACHDRFDDYEHTSNVMNKQKPLQVKVGEKRKLSFAEAAAKRLKSVSLEYDKITVKELKDILRGLGATEKGKKQELLDRVRKLQDFINVPEQQKSDYSKFGKEFEECKFDLLL